MRLLFRHRPLRAALVWLVALVAFGAPVTAAAQTVTQVGTLAGVTGVIPGPGGSVIAARTGAPSVVSISGGVITPYGQENFGARDMVRMPNNDIMVADISGNRIVRYASGCATPCAGTTFVSVTNPHGLAVDAAGNLYIASNAVGVFRVMNGTATVETLVAEAATFAGIAVTNNILYVRRGAGVSTLAADCVTPCTFAAFAAVSAAARGLVWDEPSGTLFVADVDAIRRISAGGTVSLFATLPGGSSAEYMRASPGGLLVADLGGGRIFEIAIIRPVPTLSDWAMILMTALLGGYAVLTLARRRSPTIAV